VAALSKAPHPWKPVRLPSDRRPACPHGDALVRVTQRTARHLGDSRARGGLESSWAHGGSPCSGLGRAGAGQEGEDLADGAFLAGEFR
jgi:hypothetical protein